MKPSGIYLGLMSGTSADGLDIALCEITDQHNVKLLHSYYAAYPPAVRQQVIKLQLADQPTSAELSMLDQQLATFVSTHVLATITEAGIDPSLIRAIANHGQTIQHQPNAKPPFSLQLGNAEAIAEQTGITVAADFRREDIENGGQGAPLMPAFHQQVFHQHAPCSIINIGGIANITALNAQSGHTLGFDTGPGNTLLNYWIAKHRNQAYDSNGDWANTGQLQTKLLNDLLADSYFHAPYPKSTGQDYFNPVWLKRILAQHPIYAAEDIQYTLTALTAISIANEIKRLNKAQQPTFVCGGGVHNRLMIELLANHLPDSKVQTTQAAGIDPDWVEAIGFAWLGYCRLANLPANLPAVTGAKKSVILGSIISPKTIGG